MAHVPESEKTRPGESLPGTVPSGSEGVDFATRRLMARRILVVDDDPGIRDALRMILEYEGYEVSMAADGRAGLAEVESSAPDAVLLDIKMPGMDGFETLDRIVAREGWHDRDS